MYHLYKHINPINNNVFYIGSGKDDRPYQLGKSQRGANYYLYCINNKLVIEYPHGSIGFNVKVEIIKSFSNKAEAMLAEHKLINKFYGIYPLLNTISGFDSFVPTIVDLEKRSKIVSLSRSIPCKELTSGIIFTSALTLSQHYDIKYTTIQKRLKTIKMNGYKTVAECEANHLWYKDSIYPMQLSKPVSL